jgi:hypothetical protein
MNLNIPVEVDGNKLSMPWAGGLNSVQINTMDLNGDNHQDLVLFDRTANKLLTYINEQNKFIYKPEYEEQFPSEITQWVLLRDFNCDGKKDIFTSDPFGIIVFVNTSKPGENLTWRLFNPGFPLLTKGFTSNVNLKVNETDIPAIDDIDGDGDLDILNVRFVGIGSVEYHKNLSIERTGKCDSLQLERVTQSYGDFEECQCGVFAFGETCAELSGGRVQHAGGKAMVTLDIDNDGAREILFAEENCSHLYLLRNDGTLDSALIRSASSYPLTDPAIFINFPAPYIEDVDFDNLGDLIVSPNLYARTILNVDFKNSMWFYKNTGTSTIPNFILQKKNYIQDEMIDVGDYAIPALADFEGDGDLDLFISNYADQNFSSNIYFFENIGDNTTPSFKLTNSDFLGFSQFNYYNLKLQFADIDSDGTKDLVFTATEIQNGLTSLYYAPNKSKDFLAFGGQSIHSVNFTIDGNETILVVDINLDGLSDLLVGKLTGSIEYWRNTGPVGQLNYVLEESNFHGFGSSIERQSPALAIGDLDADGKRDLIVADQKGFVSIYGDLDLVNESTVPEKEIIYSPVTASYISKNMGGRIWPVIGNLFNSDKPEIILGNVMGGIRILKNDGGKSLPEIPEIDFYPNPVVQEETIIIKSDRNIEAQFFSMLGQKMSEPFWIPAHQEYSIKISGLAKGIYIARFTANHKIVSKKFVVQ